MPRLSDTMEEGTILRWLKQDGEWVKRGEELVEIETDKANMTYESDRDGILHTVAREGDTLAVGEPIAQIGEQLGAPADGVEDAAPSADGAEDDAATERATATASSLGNGTPPEQTTTDRVKASPLARRIAQETGVDLRSLTGSGPGGRIVKADVEASAGASAAAPTATAPAGAATVAPPDTAAAARSEAVPAPAQAAPTVGELASAKGETRVAELSRIQRTIARRMAESKATIPDFALQADVDMQRCVELRTELKRLAQPATTAPSAQHGVDGQTVAPTYNDMVLKACALALRDHPRANGSYRDGRFELHSRVNVGVAVAVDAEDPLRSALVVPTIFDADSKALGEIARETRSLAERVRDGSITPPELSGGTFTVSNLGMYGVRSFTAIVNPPQAAILAVGSVERRAVVDTKGIDRQAQGDAHDGGVVARHTMSVTLSCDHRILYGADAALFLARIRELLEEPTALAL
jgi:pyruvate dehydrogenase E2 component (dihydrolipoyllysine-residue acetyltransferase)